MRRLLGYSDRHQGPVWHRHLMGWRPKNVVRTAMRMVDANEERPKLVICTEHRDTLTYLWEHNSTLFGCDNFMVSTDGSVPRDQRRVMETESATIQMSISWWSA